MPAGPPLFIKPRAHPLPGSRPPGIRPGKYRAAAAGVSSSPAAAARYLPGRRRSGAGQAAEQLDVPTFATRPRASQHPRCLAPRSGTCLIIADPAFSSYGHVPGAPQQELSDPLCADFRHCSAPAEGLPRRPQRPPLQSPHRLHAICIRPSRLAGVMGPARRDFPTVQATAERRLHRLHRAATAYLDPPEKCLRVGPRLAGTPRGLASQFRARTAALSAPTARASATPAPLPRRRRRSACSSQVPLPRPYRPTRQATCAL